jgi:hypothetical protein
VSQWQMRKCGGWFWEWRGKDISFRLGCNGLLVREETKRSIGGRIGREGKAMYSIYSVYSVNLDKPPLLESFDGVFSV